MPKTCVFWWPLIALCSAGTGCAGRGGPQEAKNIAPASIQKPLRADEVQAKVEDFASRANVFAFDLWEKLESDGNAVISPASIYMALSMTAGGARAQTAEEMDRVLNLGSDPDRVHRAAGLQVRRWRTKDEGIYSLRMANRIFLHRKLMPKPDFLAFTGDLYGALPARLDFAEKPEASRIRINQWVAEQTADRIQDVLPAGTIDALSRMVLVNGVYFLGEWEAPFSESRTDKRHFFVSPRETIDILTMHQKGDFSFGRTDKVQLLDMPYRATDLSMVFVLPHQRFGLAAIEAGMDGDMVQAWFSALGEPGEIEVHLPRFRIDPLLGLDLKEPLKSLGMRSAFEPNTANFMGIAPQLFVDDVFHKTMIAVNELGTETSSTTIVLHGLGSPPGRPPPPFFRADHPFLFFLRDKNTHTILFMGRVQRPEAS